MTAAHALARVHPEHYAVRLINGVEWLLFRASPAARFQAVARIVASQ